MSSGPWTAFKAVRVVLFALASILCITLTIIFTILLIREWSLYNISQRIIVVVSLTINGVSAILLYLMIVVQFRLWLDAARVASLILFQLGSTVTFAIVSSSLPCKNIGSETDCRHILTGAVDGGWVLTGLLLLYAFYLAVMSYIPLPSPPSNPEDALLESKKSQSPRLSGSSQMSLKQDSKNRRYNSPYGSFVQSPQTSLSLLHGTFEGSLRSRTISSHQHEMYRSGTPASTYSSAPSSITVTMANERSTPFISPVRLPSSQTLPNPFLDATSSRSSPFSMATSAKVDDRDTGRFQAPGFLPQYSYQSSKPYNPPSYVDKESLPATPVTAFLPNYLIVPGTPLSLRPAVRPALPPRELTASPSIWSVHSINGSLHLDGTGSRSPTTSPMPLGLPASPRVVKLALPPPAFSASSSIVETRGFIGP